MAFAAESQAPGVSPGPDEAFQKWLRMKGEMVSVTGWKVLDVSSHQEQIPLPPYIWLGTGAEYVEMK